MTNITELLPISYVGILQRLNQWFYFVFQLVPALFIFGPIWTVSLGLEDPFKLEDLFIAILLLIVRIWLFIYVCQVGYNLTKCIFQSDETLELPYLRRIENKLNTLVILTVWINCMIKQIK